MIQETCVTCHNETTLLGNLSLEVFYFENFAELDKGSPVMRALGPEGAQAATAKLSGIVSSSALWVARVIPELSFGAKEQGPASESKKEERR